METGITFRLQKWRSRSNNHPAGQVETERIPSPDDKSSGKSWKQETHANDLQILRNSRIHEFGVKMKFIFAPKSFWPLIKNKGCICKKHMDCSQYPPSNGATFVSSTHPLISLRPMKKQIIKKAALLLALVGVLSVQESSAQLSDQEIVK